MLINIKVCKNRYIEPSRRYLGTTGEHNATVLRFVFFKELNGKLVSELKKELVAVNSKGSFPYEFTDEFSIPSELTTDTEISFQIKLYEGNTLVWKSVPHTFTLDQSIDDSGNNTIQSVVNEAKEAYRNSLASSVSVATGDDHSGKTWDELNNTVAELPILKEEQIQELGGWELVKAAMAGVTADRHNLFRNAPVDENGAPRYFRLPYIYTPKMAWIAHDCLISTYLTEFGVDVSSAVSLGSNQAENTFSPLPNLQHLVLTGNANSPTLQSFMYANSALQYLKMDAPSEDALRATPNYYQSAFSACNNLEIIDCELDFTGQTNVRNTFNSCYKLKHLRIKPFTLSTSLNLGSCRNLHHTGSGDYDSLISILNGITNDREVAKNITITFSNEITDFTVGMTLHWNKPVYGCDNGLYYSDPSEVPEGYANFETQLYDAFISKGVTIAWV